MSLLARKNKSTRNTKSRKIKLMVSLFVLMAVLVSAAVLSVFNSKTFSYYSVAATQPNGGILVEYVDFTNDKIYEIKIPESVEVNLARQRGTLRANAIEKLVSSENLPGEFISDTIIKTFHFPIDYWKHGLSSDIPLSVRLKYNLKKVTGINRETIDLRESNYLYAEKLIDGEPGYKVRDTMPLLLQSIFADPAFSGEYRALQLVNKTGEHQYYLHNLIELFNVMGVKVAPVLDKEKASLDCLAISNDEKILAKIGSVLNCDIKIGEPEAFDIELVVGEDFIKRF